jgi:excisionase family DNA binding protein
MPRLGPNEVKAMKAVQKKLPALCSRKAAAHKLGVTERSVDRAVKDQQLKAIRVGGRVMITNASLDALLAS